MPDGRLGWDENTYDGLGVCMDHPCVVVILELCMEGLRRAGKHFYITRGDGVAGMTDYVIS